MRQVQQQRIRRRQQPDEWNAPDDLGDAEQQAEADTQGHGLHQQRLPEGADRELLDAAAQGVERRLGQRGAIAHDEGEQQHDDDPGQLPRAAEQRPLLRREGVGARGGVEVRRVERQGKVAAALLQVEEFRLGPVFGDRGPHQFRIEVADDLALVGKRDRLERHRQLLADLATQPRQPELDAHAEDGHADHGEAHAEQQLAQAGEALAQDEPQHEEEQDRQRHNGLQRSNHIPGRDLDEVRRLAAGAGPGRLLGVARSPLAEESRHRLAVAAEVGQLPRGSGVLHRVAGELGFGFEQHDRLVAVLRAEEVGLAHRLGHAGQEQQPQAEHEHDRKRRGQRHDAEAAAD